MMISARRIGRQESMLTAMFYMALCQVLLSALAQPDHWAFMGAALIAASGIYIAMRRRWPLTSIEPRGRPGHLAASFLPVKGKAPPRGVLSLGLMISDRMMVAVRMPAVPTNDHRVGIL